MNARTIGVLRSLCQMSDSTRVVSLDVRRKATPGTPMRDHAKGTSAKPKPPATRPRTLSSSYASWICGGRKPLVKQLAIASS